MDEETASIGEETAIAVQCAGCHDAFLAMGGSLNGNWYWFGRRTGIAEFSPLDFDEMHRALDEELSTRSLA